MPTEINNYAEDFAAAVQEKFPAEGRHDHYSVVSGRKFDKIVRDHSVYAFVNIATGELIKAATWKAPAFNVNGETAGKYFLNTDEGFAIALHNADRFGSFLYHDYKVRVDY